MPLLKRFAQGELQLNRIEGFSDGVFAIVVTLLVLELKVPILHDRGNASELGRQLVDLLPKFLSWLISFVIVCKFWLNHHHLLTFARHATYGMIWLNSIFLMGQAFIPFPTALMGEHPAQIVRRPGFYLLGVAVTLFNVQVAFVLYALAPLFFITPLQPRGDD